VSLTTYSYTSADQLTLVTMTRGSVTQHRIFLYTGSDLTSANNPENGTVTYTYDSSHHVTTRIDQLGSNTIYSYDSYGRLHEAQYYPSNNSGAEDTAQRGTYYYDGVYPCTGVSAAYTTGRLTESRSAAG
jgi:YD repeat-containing protein